MSTVAQLHVALCDLDWCACRDPNPYDPAGVIRYLNPDKEGFVFLAADGALSHGWDWNVNSVYTEEEKQRLIIRAKEKKSSLLEL